MSLSSLKKKAFKNPEVKQAYDELHDEFVLIEHLISMREESGLTQNEVAERMGTKASNISRLESGRANPSLKTLKNYAGACGFKLGFNFHKNQCS